MSYSSELKYRIEIRWHGFGQGSRGSVSQALSARNRFTLFLFMLPFSTIWLWEDWFVSPDAGIQTLVQMGLSVLMLLLCWQRIRSPAIHGLLVLSLSDTGQCLVLGFEPESSTVPTSHRSAPFSQEMLAFMAHPWQITERSRLLPGMLWLHFKSGNRVYSTWLFKDEVSERDFRRLCRVVRYCHQYGLQQHS